MADVVTALIEAVKKFPTRAAGGAIDLANMIAGGYANIADVVSGKEVSRQVGDGLVPKPILGTDHLNSIFGLSNERSSTENVAGAVMDLLTPTGQLTSAAKAMVLPALAIKSVGEVSKAMHMLDAKVLPEDVFAQTGIYRGLGDTAPRALLDASHAKLRSGATTTMYAWNNPGLVSAGGSNITYFAGLTKELSKVLDFPELYAAMPELRTVKVHFDPNLGVNEAKAGGGNIWINSIASGDQFHKIPVSSEENFMSVLLHEVGHIVQDEAGHLAGGTSKSFFADYSKWNITRDTARKDLADVMTFLADKFGVSPASIRTGNLPNTVLKSSEYGVYKALNFRVQQFGGEEKLAYAQYKSIYGEAEARAIQTMFHRKDYTTFPLFNYDVPQNSLIISPHDSPLKLVEPSGAPTTIIK